MQHQPVLLQESIDGLAIKADGIYIDGTFGRGGHSQLILQHLSANGRLLAIDKDPDAIAYANHHFNHDKRLHLFHGSFAELPRFAREVQAYGVIDGILLDLGVSSPQLDNAVRGFSFRQSGPLDMRMNTIQSLDAKHFVNHTSLEDMVRVFRDYGEERFSNRIAKAIVEARLKAPIKTTDALADIIKLAHPRWEKHKHPATRIFQAIRIYINDELSDLSHGLTAALETLGVGGRLAVISFHSLEDRIVKQFMRCQEIGHQPPPGIPIRANELKTCFKRIGKAIKPSNTEIGINSRSRSAVLRVGEKIA